MDIANVGLERQRAKRKRVARMKKMIISTIMIFMLLTLCVMTFLVVEVISLQRQIDVLSSRMAVTETVDDTDEMADDGFLDNVYQVDNMDNIAEEGDIPMVYLTFDDGPSENTDDILDDYNVKATFFVVGKDVDTYGDAYRRIVADGHTIGMHSYSHNYSKIYQSEKSFVADYNKIHELIYDTTGVDTKLYRFPGGSSNKVSNTSMSAFINYLNESGTVYYDWNVASGDATSQAFTADELVDNVMSDVVKYKTSVVLLHDSSDKNATVEALPRLIEELNDAGAMILPITDDTTIIQHVSVVQ